MQLTATYKQLGAGMLYAGAAIGVSHLVQSTRAGAEYGYYMVLFIVLVHLFKYPFFRFGPSYAHATGQSILHGYAHLGKGVVWMFIGLTISTMFTVIAAVTVVTAGLAHQVSGLALGDVMWSALLLSVSVLVLWSGRYNFLSRLMRWVIILLAICTVAALAGSFLTEIPDKTGELRIFSWRNATDIAFLMAFVGWMPAPMDISIWHSVWTARDLKSRGTNRPKQPGFDFYIGYYGTAIMAIIFLTLGVRLFYGSGVQTGGSASDFAGQLIGIYTTVLGEGAFYLIAAAALLTMLSTVLTCLDAFPRVLAESWMILFPDNHFRTTYRILVVALALGALAILIFLMGSMRQMVDFATTISFLTTPLLALLSYWVFLRDPAVSAHKPRGWYRLFVWVSLGALIAFGVFYLLYS
ncbi:MAG: divalent metal cation transporter [Flavobacteriales bacterium]|nr:divalent metal cation transporter [Flavobacteriales bacterium]